MGKIYTILIFCHTQLLLTLTSKHLYAETDRALYKAESFKESNYSLKKVIGAALLCASNSVSSTVWYYSYLSVNALIFT